MKVLRVHIKGWTGSYRFPPFVMAQPTLPVPPPSTCYGIISAAVGNVVSPGETQVGFVAPYRGKASDLEKIYQVDEHGKIEQLNIVKREFIYEPELYLYVTNYDFHEHFIKPRYPILLGRSSDLAYIKATKVIELEQRSQATFQHTLLPFPFQNINIAAPICALPIAFTDAVPRRPVKVSSFYIIEKPMCITGENLLVDPEKEWGVFLHGGVC